MKIKLPFLLTPGIFCWLLGALPAAATVYYVDGGNPAPTPPYTTWATAATNIQDAVNLTASGDTVLVTNGVYASSGLVITGGLTNRVALTNAITVQSVNGPWVTTIYGAGATIGTKAVRCAWLTNGASLVGFTLAGGATLFSGNNYTTESGGGAWCASSNSMIADCVISSNAANEYGGGVYQGTVVNCLISTNGSLLVGGGASYQSVLVNCTVVSNATVGAASPLAMTNCILYYNAGGNYTASGSAFAYCCTTPALAGAGNFTNAPQLFADGVHLAYGSPCFEAGIGTPMGTDIFGQTWSNPPSVGCAEWQPQLVILPQLSIQFPAGGGFTIGVNADGQPPITDAWTENGQPIQNNGHFSGARTPMLAVSNPLLSDSGAYQVVVSNSFGTATSAVLQVTIHCVAASGTAPLPPYSSWTTAATNIQDAINVGQPGDIILVTNGTYAFGGIAMAGGLTNRVALTNAVIVQSVNGPWVTTIYGAGATNGSKAVRCAWLTNGASLVGFTLAAGATLAGGNNTTYGGGAWCASSNSMIANCVISSNTAYQYGGGVYQGTVVNCLISSNGSSEAVGASYQSVLINCTVVSNATVGAVGPLAMTNCILYYNAGGNYSASGSAFACCCTTPALAGTGNITNSPGLFADGVHLANNSPCIGAGVGPALGNDIFGQTWSNPPSIGCAEWNPAPAVLIPQIQLTGNPVGFTLSSAATGVPPFSFFWLENGVPVPGGGSFSGVQTASLAASGANLSDAGIYQLVVSNAFGVVTSGVAQLTMHCVNVSSGNPLAPYSTWATAATDIQDAISAAAPGDIVLVTNGLYATGGKSEDGVITNRVAVDKAILVQSLNGSASTTIQGAWDATSTNGPGAIRCVWLTTNAILSGFTVCGGATRAYSAGGQSIYGGGIWGPVPYGTPLATVANCLIVSNAAAYLGGGAGGVNLNYCTLATNLVFSVSTGGGGGAYLCTLENCYVAGNLATGSATLNGGGVSGCKLTNCAVVGNSASWYGGGAYSSTLINCTVTGNQVLVPNTSSSYGGGVANSTLANCIVYGNANSDTAYPYSSNYYGGTITYSCTLPAVSGTGNIAANPLLLPDGLHLAANSPCIGAGNSNVVSGVDLEGQPWNTPPSMGCVEWQPAPLMFAPPGFQPDWPAHGLICAAVVAGQAPFTAFWTKDGQPVQGNGHYSTSGTTSLTINNLGPADGGAYQVVVTNSYGSATSTVSQLVVHAVNAAGTLPVAPYATWATAATNIQDAINVASAGDVVLVTNGVYACGGLVLSGGLTNRVAINQALTVMSVNGAAATEIQGAWDPNSGNGPEAVRCAYIANGAWLIGFTLANGATLATGAGPVESGGGIYCLSTAGAASNCVLSNNSAIYGGGFANGTLGNSLVIENQANYGGGAFSADLVNCTVSGNIAILPGKGAGICANPGYFVENCIVVENYDYFLPNLDNYFYQRGESGIVFSNSCSSPIMPGTGNTNVDPQLMDLYHIATTSPCRGAGNAAYASGADLDGEPWNNPPSIGCEEVVVSNLVGPLSVSIATGWTNVLVNRTGSYGGFFTGRAASDAWNFGDGVIVTNVGPYAFHSWANAGLYPVTFTAYNNDNPAGVSTGILVNVEPLNPPQLQIAGVTNNTFQFQFTGQTNATYVIQYTTNLVPPVTWNTLQTLYFNSQAALQISDAAATNQTRFYRVSVQ